MPGLDPGIHHLQETAFFLMDCRVIQRRRASRFCPAMTRQNNERNPRMRRNSARLSIALVLIAPLLGGCLERGQPTMVNAKAERAQRNLGEYMLNHPYHP